jgi:hypothetical protein
MQIVGMERQGEGDDSEDKSFRGAFIFFTRWPSVGCHLGEPLMPACTNRISQALDDPFHSIRGPPFLPRFFFPRQGSVPDPTGVYLRMSPALVFEILRIHCSSR